MVECGSFTEMRGRVDDFVRRHFRWPGTLHLHRAALGGDVLRAPVNVVLSPVLALTRASGWLARRLGFQGVAVWLASRRILLGTAVGRQVEALVFADLLGVPMAGSRGARDTRAMQHAVLAAPRFREVFRSRGSVAEAEALADRIAVAVREYAGVRSAVAEMTTAVAALTVGAVVYHAVTPGMISLAPGVAETVSRSTAVAEFPLGEGLGGLWYSVFPVGPSPAMVAGTVVLLVMAGAVVAAFAGVIADPVQARLGIHRRRLMRLVDSIEADLSGMVERPFAAREHFYVRAVDLWDLALGLLRALRG